MKGVEYWMGPVYCDAVIGIQERECIYKLVNAQVQLMSIDEVKAHKDHLVE